MRSEGSKRLGNPDPHVRSWLKSTNPDLLWASLLIFGEIRKESQRLVPGMRWTDLWDWLERDLEEWFEERLLPVTKTIASTFGSLSAGA